MEEAELIRCTFIKGAPEVGVFVWHGEPRFLTLEPPDNNNQVLSSCIPTGKYHCKKVFNRRTLGGTWIEQTFLVDGVPERGGILFHIGNVVQDTRGCILVGMSFGELEGKQAILASAAAFRLFNDLMVDVDEFSLFVRHA